MTEIDKYTYFPDISVADFLYVLHCLHNSGAITINDDDTMYAVLLNVLEEYQQEVQE